MATLLGERMREAQEKKMNNLKDFVWLLPRDKDNNNKQQEVKLIDCTEEQLNSFYTHCETMLHNEDKDNPGRYIVLRTINAQSDKVGTELLLRELEEEEGNNFDRFSFAVTIDRFLDKNKDNGVDPKICTLKQLLKVPRKYEDLNLQLIKDGCMDKLGIFNNPHITKSFVLKMGLWFNKSNGDYKVLKEFTKDFPENKVIEEPRMLTLAKMYLKVNGTNKLRFNPNGIGLTQMEGILSLISKPKRFKDLTNLQLLTLRYRVLFDLIHDVKEHISKWEELKRQITLVAKSKGFKLNTSRTGAV